MRSGRYERADCISPVNNHILLMFCKHTRKKNLCIAPRNLVFRYRMFGLFSLEAGVSCSTWQAKVLSCFPVIRMFLFLYLCCSLLNKTLCCVFAIIKQKSKSHCPLLSGKLLCSEGYFAT